MGLPYAKETVSMTTMHEHDRQTDHGTVTSIAMGDITLAMTCTNNNSNRHQIFSSLSTANVIHRHHMDVSERQIWNIQQSSVYTTEQRPSAASVNDSSNVYKCQDSVVLMDHPQCFCHLLASSVCSLFLFPMLLAHSWPLFLMENEVTWSSLGMRQKLSLY